MGAVSRPLMEAPKSDNSGQCIIKRFCRRIYQETVRLTVSDHSGGEGKDPRRLGWAQAVPMCKVQQ